VHDLDENGDLKSAAKIRSSNKGVGKDQTGKSDRYRMVQDMLDVTRSLNGDTAVTLEEAGGTKNYYGPNTDFECATIDGETYVHLRAEDEILYKVRRFYRQENGNHSRWVEDTEIDCKFPIPIAETL
jgi:hypothetical protein